MHLLVNELCAVSMSVFVSLVSIASVVVVRSYIYYSGTVLLLDVEGCACS